MATAPITKAVDVHVSFLTTFFIQVILPVLPALILQAFPQIQNNAKLIKVLKQVDDVLDQVIGGE